MFIFLFINSLLVPLSMILLGKIWSKKPPKGINSISGYRTTMSMLNQDTWKYAHEYWGNMSYIIGIVMAIVTAVVMVSIKGQRNFESISTYLVFIQLAIFVLTIIPTEIKLNKVFDKNGHRK